MARPKSMATKAADSAKRGGKVDGRGKHPNARAVQFRPGNVYRIKPGQVLNPTGKTRSFAEVYAERLARIDIDDPYKRTGQELIADILLRWTKAEDPQTSLAAARELRQAVDGIKQANWQDEVITLLKRGTVTPDEVTGILGADARPLLVAAGLSGNEAVPPETDGGAADDPDGPGPA